MRPATAVNAWVREVARDGATPSPNTWKTYAHHLLDFFSYLEEHNLPWTQIGVQTLIDYRDVQALYRSAHTKEFLDRKTVNARLLSVCRFYRFAQEEGFIEQNPVKYKRVKTYPAKGTRMLSHITNPGEREVPSVIFGRVGKSAIKWQSDDKVVRWLNSVPSWRNKLIAKILYRTGMRRAEVVNLKTYDLPELKSVEGSRPEIAFSILGKGAKDRLVYIPAHDLIELYDYIRIERAKLIKRCGAKHDYIFVSRNGGPMNPITLNPIFRRISGRCQIRVSPHTLRHSFAVQSLKKWRAIGLSQPEKLLQSRLGHSSILTTEIYMHITDETNIEEAHANAGFIEMFVGGGNINEEK